MTTLAIALAVAKYFIIPDPSYDPSGMLHLHHAYAINSEILVLEKIIH
jgi:hypothetical protein